MISHLSASACSQSARGLHTFVISMYNGWFLTHFQPGVGNVPQRFLVHIDTRASLSCCTSVEHLEANGGPRTVVSLDVSSGDGCGLESQSISRS